MERETGIEPATFSFGRWPSRIVQQRMFGQLATTAHSTRNLVTASVQRCAAQHPGRRAAETVCRQFQYPRLRFSRRHLRQIWLSWRHGLPLGTEIWGGEDAEFEPRCLRRTWRLSRFWLTTWKRSPSVSPSGTSFGSLHRRLRQQTVLRRLNTKHPPGKGPFAVRAAPVLSPWLPSVSPAALLAAVVVVSASAVLGVGNGPHFFRRCQEGQGSFRAGLAVLLAMHGLATSRGLAVAWRSTTTCCFSSTQEQDQPRQHRQQLPAASPTKKSTDPGTPCKPVAAVARAAPGVAGGSRGVGLPDGAAPASNGRQRRPCRLR